MIFSWAARHRGQCDATTASPLMVVVEGKHAERAAGVVSAYLSQNPDAAPLLAASAIMRRLGQGGGLHMLRAGILHVEEGAAQAKLTAVGDVRLWRRRGRNMERFSPPMGKQPSQDAVGLPGSQIQRIRVPLEPGDRLVIGSRALGRLGALELYAVLSSPRGAASAADALLERLSPAPDAVVGVLWVDPQR